MSALLKSVVAGAASGALTFAASIFAMSAASTSAPPFGASYQAWDAIVVLGVCAGLTAALVHFFSVRTLGARLLPSFAAFTMTATGILAASNLLAFFGKALLAWLAGALLASVVQRLLRPNNSFKGMPLRGTP